MYPARHILTEGKLYDRCKRLVPALMIILAAGCSPQGEVPFHEEHSDGAPPTGIMGMQDVIQPADPAADTPDTNRAPVIISEPVATINHNLPYLYPARALDPDGDPVTWSLQTTASGLYIDPHSGAIYGMKLVPGSHSVSISAGDGQGGIAEQRFTLVVTANPVIHSAAPNHTFSGYPYTYQVYASSPDNTALEYTLETGPSGMTIASDSGRLEWETPVAGNHEVVINVASVTGTSASEEYVLDVVDANSLAIISSPETTAFEWQPYAYQVSVLSLTEAEKTYTLTESEPGMTIDASTGLLTWIPQTPGRFRVELAVLDVNGRTGSQGFDIHVRSLEEMDQLFRWLVRTVLDSLVAGDTNMARVYLAGETQDDYMPVLEALLPYMDEIVANLGAMERVSISNTSAEYVIPRTLNGETRLYIVTFVQDAEGNWRLYSI